MKDKAQAPESCAPALVQLRALTQAHHQTLEDALQLDRPHMDRSTYVALLQRFHALYCVLEAQHVGQASLAGWQSELEQMGLGWSARRKLPLLEADLQALGVSPLEDIQKLSGKLRLGDIAAVLGCLYVLEGSTLGGQFISRKLSSQLGLTRASGLAFFSGYGPKTGVMWRTMRSVLSRELVEADSIKRAVESAQSTFALFHAWLVQPSEGAREANGQIAAARGAE